MAKHTAKSKSNKSNLQLHQLLTALSFWGTTTRFLLFAVMATLTLIVVISQASGAITPIINLYIYVLVSFFLFDVGSVMLARGLELKPAVDRVFIVSVDTIIALWYVIPRFIPLKMDLVTAIMWLLLVVIVLLSFRSVLGLVYRR